MSRIIFNLAAKCEAAGRSQNQDNYWICPDLGKWDAPTDGVVGTDEDVELSEKGALLVVADGMGGMNAGEKASELVIEGIKKKFSNIPDSLLSDEEEILKFIQSAIIEADELIKKYAKVHREAEGLGSTIVLLWLLNGRAFCGWCGDSRIYRFNPNNELIRLSHDHSYVQSLVDEGKITAEEAFEHPDGNIISKSLGDNGNKADPELKVYDVYQRDMFLLCSDGLCGILQDYEIGRIIEETCTSSKDTLKALWEKGEKIGWSDNSTINLLCIVDGGKPAKGRPDGYSKVVRKTAERTYSLQSQIVSGGDKVSVNILKSPYFYIGAILVSCMFGFGLFHFFGDKVSEKNTNFEYSIAATNVDESEENDSKNRDAYISSNSSARSGVPQKPDKSNKTNNMKESSESGRFPGVGNPQGFHGKSSEGTANSGNGTPESVTEHSNPSKTFMQAYDRVRDVYGKTNETVKRMGTRYSKSMTFAERNLLINYNKVWNNNKDILKKEYYKAKEQQGDIKAFEELNNDVEQKLRSWGVNDDFQRQQPRNQQQVPKRNQDKGNSGQNDDVYNSL